MTICCQIGWELFFGRFILKKSELSHRFIFICLHEYLDIFRTPDYFWFDPETLEFAGFHLLDGEYQPLVPNPQGCLWSQQLGLYLGVYQEKLRFFTSGGELISTPQEVAQQEKQRSDRLAAKLRELNIDPDSI